MGAARGCRRPCVARARSRGFVRAHKGALFPAAPGTGPPAPAPPGEVPPRRGRLQPAWTPPSPVAVGLPPPHLQPLGVGGRRMPAAAFARPFALGVGAPCGVISYFYLCMCLFFSLGFGVLGFYPQGRDSQPQREPRCPPDAAGLPSFGTFRRRDAACRDCHPYRCCFLCRTRSPILPHRGETRPPPPRRQVGPGQ